MTIFRKFKFVFMVAALLAVTLITINTISLYNEAITTVYVPFTATQKGKPYNTATWVRGNLEIVAGCREGSNESCNLTMFFPVFLP